MTSKVSGPRKNSRLGSARPTASEGSRRRTLGPELAFGGAVFASFAAWGASTVTLPPDLIMPVVATLFLGFAAVLAMFARRDRDLDSGQVTYADVAGALTLIGLSRRAQNGGSPRDRAQTAGHRNAWCGNGDLLGQDRHP